MRKFIISFTITAVLAVLVASCVNIDFADQVIPGQRISSMAFSITTPSPNNVVSTKAMTDPDETNIESLALFFFKEGSTGAANRVFVSGSDFSLDAPDEMTPTNYIYNITLGEDQLDSQVHDEVICSGNWYIYAVANWDKSWVNVDLEALKGMSRSELDDFRVVKSSTSPNPSETAILLAGRYGEDNTGLAVLAPDASGKVSLDGMVHLRRFVSKFTFRFNSGTDVNFVPERVFIYNYSRSATLFERSGWRQADGTESYRYGTFPGKLTKAVASSGNVMADALNSGLGYEVMRDGNGYYYTFYMPENIPSPKSGASISSYNDRDVCTYASDGLRTFTNAPDDATYVVVTGSYDGPAIDIDEANQTAVQYNDADRRVQGMVSYTIHLGNFSTTGANTLGSDDNFTVRRNAKYQYNVTVNGARSIAVEAAFDREDNPGAEGYLLTTSTGTTNIRLDAHYEQVIIAIPNGVFDGYELILDTPYSSRQIVRSRNDDLDVNWVKFARPASETTFRPYSQVLAGEMGNIFDLTDDLNDGDESDANNTYYLIGQDGHRYTAAYIDEYFYEALCGDVDDLSPARFVNAPDRELTFSTGVSVSSDKHSSFTVTPIFTIRQRSIVSPYNLESVANPMGMETIEETAANSTFGGNGTSDTNGWANTTQGLSLGSSSWSAFVNETVNGHVENAAIPGAALTAEGQKGIYQCLSRNRDLNGNGVIDSDEVRWFLPAMSQSNSIWFGDPFLSEGQHVNNSNRYFCSTKGLSTWWVLEGTAYNEVSASSLVRCVRALGSYNQETTPIWSMSENADGNAVFTIQGLNEAAERSDSQVGEYQPHFTGDKQNDMLPRQFVVAKDYMVQYEYVEHPAIVQGTRTIASFESDHSQWHYEVDGFLSDCQYVTVSMTLDNSASAQDIVSFGNTDSYSKWNQNPVVHVYYPASNNAPSGQSGSGFVEICINGGHLAAPVAENGRISVRFDGSRLTVISGDQSTDFDLPASFAQVMDLVVASAEGSGRTIATDYSIELTTTESREAYVEPVVVADRFNDAQVTRTNLCSSNYYENADRSDLGQWRVPNEKEFSFMYLAQQSGDGTFLKNATAARSRFDRRAEDGYSDTGESLFYYNSNGRITTSLDYTKPSTFYVRCVRDPEGTSGSASTNSSEQNSMSNGGFLW